MDFVLGGFCPRGVLSYTHIGVEEEESFRSYVECEVPRELLLHRVQLMPPLEIGLKRFKENE